MKRMIKHHRNLLLMVIGIIMTSIGYSQISRSAYFLDYLPIANGLNPAFTSPGEAFLSLPLISSTYVSVNLPLNYSEIIRKSEVNDNIYINKQAMLNELDDVNMFSANFYSMIGQFGLRFNKHIFQVGLAKVATTNLTIEKDMIEFLLKGNAHPDIIGRNINLSKTGINFTLYHEISLGYALEYNNKISMGVKLKYLNGQVNIYTEKNNLNIFTSDKLDYSITASTDLAVHTSTTYGQLNELGDQNIMNYAWIDFSGNHGFAIDIGAVYRPLPKLRLSLSAVDMGKIKWKEYVNSYVSKNPGKEYTYKGIDINDFFMDNSLVDTIPMLDSIANHFEIEELNEPYSSYLIPKLYIGADYDLTNYDQFGFLFKTEFYHYSTLPYFTLNYKRKFGRSFSTIINYTLAKNNSSVGLGLAAKSGPINIYCLTDSVLSYISALKAKTVNLQFGICFIFGDQRNSN
jgi:hypothetical protein